MSSGINIAEGYAVAAKPLVNEEISAKVMLLKGYCPKFRIHIQRKFCIADEVVYIFGMLPQIHYIHFNSFVNKAFLVVFC